MPVREIGLLQSCAVESSSTTEVIALCWVACHGMESKGMRMRVLQTAEYKNSTRLHDAVGQSFPRCDCSRGVVDVL